MCQEAVGPKEQYAVAWDHIIHQNEYRHHLQTFLTTLTLASLVAVAWLIGERGGTSDPRTDPLSVTLAAVLLAAVVIGFITILFVTKAWDVRDRFLAASALLANAPGGRDILGFALTAKKGERDMARAEQVEGLRLGGYFLTICIFSFETATLAAAASYLLCRQVCPTVSALIVGCLLFTLSGGLYQRQLRKTWPPELNIPIGWPKIPPRAEQPGT